MSLVIKGKPTVLKRERKTLCAWLLLCCEWFPPLLGSFLLNLSLLHLLCALGEKVH